MDKLNIDTIYQRVKSETPKFWKNIRGLMIACGSIGIALEALPEKYTEWMPSSVPGILIVVGVVGTALASMTVSDKKKEIDPEQPHN